MKLCDLECVDNNISLLDYYKLYNYVRENMKNPEWLGVIPKEETINILKNNGKIWIYYNKDEIVCSMFYIPANSRTLAKHNINVNVNETGSLGPIMVSPKYVGKGFMKQMLEVFNEYNKKIGNKYIFTKVATNNNYCIKNIEKDGYEIVDIYENERGKNNAYLKNI